ncbi:hypothetical protein LOK49_Contig45G00014 [Camellia lanceoleosa]|nr:hypothetical protein LOK49_Contig45G00014 [Camellia lanceoleosa]
MVDPLVEAEIEVNRTKVSMSMNLGMNHDGVSRESNTDLSHRLLENVIKGNKKANQSVNVNYYWSLWTIQCLNLQWKHIQFPNHEDHLTWYYLADGCWWPLRCSIAREGWQLERDLVTTPERYGGMDIQLNALMGCESGLKESGDSSDEKIAEEEAVCKLCFNGFNDGNVLKTVCRCTKNALIHEDCAAKWSTENRNNCDFCEGEIQNIPITLLRGPSSTEKEAGQECKKWRWFSSLRRTWQYLKSFK